jgi:Co/Zn/Cd efflux system component
MAEGCCGAPRFDGRSVSYRRVLGVVIALNAAMFLIEIAAGHVARSQALQADALDFFADAATYGLTLWAVGRSARVRARAALIKGASLGLMALWVVGSTLWRTLEGGTPEPLTMTAVGLVALAVNVGAALLLFRFRDGDANVRSVWLCSRNDAIGNVAVVAAAAGVSASASSWPDLLVAFGMASLFLHSSIRIVRQARGELGVEAGIDSAAIAAE